MLSKRWKRIGALLTAFAMCLTILPATAQAEQPAGGTEPAAAQVSVYDETAAENDMSNPTAAPTAEPAAEPTAAPTAEPTAAPTSDPTAEPTAEPTATPTAEPTAVPTADPTAAPSNGAEALSDSGYSFIRDEDGYVLVEKGWTIDVWEDLPEPANVQIVSGTSIADWMALRLNGSSASVDKDTYLSLTISSSASAGRTVTVTARHYKITAADGTVRYAAWNETPGEGETYEIEECTWLLKISNHVYDTVGVQTKAPTCLENGEMSYSCMLCHNKQQTEPIPALHTTLAEGEACPSCGQVLYTWDAESKTLTFTADIPDYTQSDYQERPYQAYADQAERVVIGDSVKQIGDYAFAYFTALKAIGPADTPEGTGLLDVEKVGYAAFWNVHGMTRYTFTEKVQDMDGCLYNCGELENVTVHSTPVQNSFGFQANEPLDGSTMVDQMVIDDPDGTLGKTNIGNAWDGIRHLTIQVNKICGSATSDDLESVTVIGAESIDPYWMYDSMWGTNVFPQLTDVTLEDVGLVGEYAFRGCTTIKNVTLKNVKAISEGGFYKCSALANVSIENVALIDAYAFDYCTSLKTLQVPEETKLGYSNIFDFSDPNFAYLKDRMFGILDGQFALEENPNPEELTVPEGWEDSELGENNEAALDKTQVTKAARWANTDKTAADVEFQFNYAKKQGMDFLFIIDYSGSMSKIGNYADGTAPDETVDDNSRFFDMQSKLLDVSEQLLNTEGYDNRVAFVTFSTDGSYLHTQDFTQDYATAENFVFSYQPYGSTNYSIALDQAYQMIQNRTDTSREAAVIFISDGQPNKFYPDIPNGKWTDLTAQINAYADKIKGIQQFGHDTKLFGVLQSIPSSDETRCQQVMEDIATEGLFFKSSDTESFSAAINNAIGATYNVYTLVDEIDPAFTLDESSVKASVGVYSIDTNPENGNTRITWTITGVPYTTHTLRYQLQLKPKADKTYPNGLFDTNADDAVITQSGAAVNAVATPTLGRGTVTMQPADMVIYMGGTKGYEGVIGASGDVITGSVSLPQPGFYMTLPEEIDQAMKTIWAESGDITEIVDADGNTSYVLNLSDYLRLVDEDSGTVWTLSLYSSGYSLAYAKYIYRVEPVQTDGNPVRLQYVDEQGGCHTDDTFVLSDALYQTYTMQIYNKAVESGTVHAQMRIGTDDWVSLPLTLATGDLTIRYVTDGQESAVTPAVTDVADAAPENGGQLENASVVIEDDMVFYINGSQIPADDANVSLLFDHVVTEETEGGEADYAQILGDTALDALDKTLANPQYEARYLDLVDANNGNVWLTPEEDVTVYWPYPEGTNSGTKFYLVHFEGLDREMKQQDLEELIQTANAVPVTVTTDAYGISFTTDSFSPYVLLWETPSTPGTDPGTTPTATPSPAPAPGSVATGDAATPVLWVVTALLGGAGVCWTIRRKRRTQGE